MQTFTMDTKEVLAFSRARDLAVIEAGTHLADPMILGWLDRRTGQHFPNVDCCQEEGKETWEIYAESRGGTVRVEVGEQYVFIFREGLYMDSSGEA